MFNLVIAIASRFAFVSKQTTLRFKLVSWGFFCISCLTFYETNDKEDTQQVISQWHENVYVTPEGKTECVTLL